MVRCRKWAPSSARHGVRMRRWASVQDGGIRVHVVRVEVGSGGGGQVGQLVSRFVQAGSAESRPTGRFAGVVVVCVVADRGVRGAPPSGCADCGRPSADTVEPEAH